jgi:PIN domain nuclease of toxin-antitoxin system
MSALLDSHALIWWISGNNRLSAKAKSTIETQEIFVSAATAYELAVKMRRGNLPESDELIRNFESICNDQRFKFLSITVRHALHAAGLDDEHRDPFDRLIAAQSLVENIPVITVDPAIHKFGCNVIW